MSNNASDTGGFAGLRVAVFESRMANMLGDLVAKHGGVPVAAPALREIPISENTEAQMFVRGLKQNEFNVVLFETGVGVRYLVEATETRLPLEDWPQLLARVVVIARGPKPASALRSLVVVVDFQVPEPNTWRETLALIDACIPIAGLRLAVQEYGKPNQELLDGLAQRGAFVTRVPVYRWALPKDCRPLRDAIQQILSGEIGAVLFTAAQQVEHVLQIANEDGHEESLRDPRSIRCRRLHRSHHLEHPSRPRPSGRSRTRTPQVGTSRRGRRRWLATLPESAAEGQLKLENDVSRLADRRFELAR